MFVVMYMALFLVLSASRFVLEVGGQPPTCC